MTYSNSVRPRRGNVVNQLNYVANTNILNSQAISATTWTDVISNQSFNISNASSQAQLITSANIQITATSNCTVSFRLLIDGATTYFVGGSTILANQYTGALTGTNSIFVSGLSAGNHTVKLQVYSTVACTLVCRPVAQSNTEFFYLSVIEHAVAVSSTGEVGTAFPNTISFSNADRTITSGECTGANLIVRQTGTLSAVRTLTLPAASAVSAGYVITVIDETGSATWWYPINVTPAGSDTITGLGSSSPLRIEIAYQSVTLISNGSNGWSISRFNQQNRRDLILLEDDLFISLSASGQSGGNLGLRTNSISGGAVSPQMTAQHVTDKMFGAVDLSINNTSGSSALVTSNINAGGQLRGGLGILRYFYRFRLSDVPVASTSVWDLKLGNVEGTNEPSTALYVMASTASSNWRCVSANAGARTYVDSGVAVATGLHEFGIEVNAAGSTARFFINGTEVSPNNTTNMPSSTGFYSVAGFVVARQGTVGGTVNAATLDKISVLIIPTSPR